MAEWTSRWRAHLSRLTEQQRDEIIFTDVYNALSDRAQQVVDGLLIEIDEEAESQERSVEYARGGLLGESEATAALNAELDEDDVWGDEYLPGTDEYEHEREMAEADVGYTFEDEAA